MNWRLKMSHLDVTFVALCAEEAVTEDYDDDEVIIIRLTKLIALRSSTQYQNALRVFMLFVYYFLLV